MKKLFCFAALCTLAGVANAEEEYLAGFAGFNLLPALHCKLANFLGGDVVESTVAFHPGYAVGLSAGYRPWQYLRVEAEGAYRCNDAKSIKQADITNLIPSGHLQKGSLLANGLLDLPLSPTLIPYVGVGVGYEWVGFSILFKEQTQNTFRLKGQDTGFAYQGIAGVSFYLADGCVRASLEYRYFNGETSRETAVASHTVDINIRRVF